MFLIQAGEYARVTANELCCKKQRMQLQTDLKHLQEALGDKQKQVQQLAKELEARAAKPSPTAPGESLENTINNIQVDQPKQGSLWTNLSRISKKRSIINLAAINLAMGLYFSAHAGGNEVHECARGDPSPCNDARRTYARQRLCLGGT